MDGAAGVLVIILSIFLAVFLLLAIILTIMLIKVTRQIKRVTHTAQKAADQVESTVRSFSAASLPLIVGRFIKNFNKFTKGGK